LAARILSTSGVLNEDQKVEDALSELGNLANSPHANIITKYFCISPSTKRLLLNYKIMVILYLIP
jgi:monomeric isocitrate dehydrogenase